MQNLGQFIALHFELYNAYDKHMISSSIIPCHFSNSTSGTSAVFYCAYWLISIVICFEWPWQHCKAQWQKPCLLIANNAREPSFVPFPSDDLLRTSQLESTEPRLEAWNIDIGKAMVSRDMIAVSKRLSLYFLTNSKVTLILFSRIGGYV